MTNNERYSIISSHIEKRRLNKMSIKSFFKSRKSAKIEDLTIDPDKINDYIKAREASDKKKTVKEPEGKQDPMLHAVGSNVGGNLAGGINNSVGASVNTITY